ncbi:unnamed protein product [Phytomonas sp. Hart1]|nr:unnamed protein product [Phytomonas sp. Hart1]|eukprot:CCW67665.1 unnamed protein product [Phytomonas sp. isolate Hart1]
MSNGTYLRDKIKVFQAPTAGSQRLSRTIFEDAISPSSAFQFSRGDSARRMRHAAQAGIPAPRQSPRPNNRPGSSRTPLRGLTPIPSESEYFYSGHTNSDASGSSSSFDPEGEEGPGRPFHFEAPTSKDLELAVAATCQAIFEKEKSLKKIELKLLNEKQNLMEAIKRRTVHHDPSSNDVIIPSLQRILTSKDSATKPRNYFIGDSPKPRAVDGNSTGTANDPTRSRTSGNVNPSPYSKVGHPITIRKTFSSPSASLRPVKEVPLSKMRDVGESNEKEIKKAVHPSSFTQRLRSQSATPKVDSTHLSPNRLAFTAHENGRLAKDFSAKQNAVGNVEGQPLDKSTNKSSSSRANINREIPSFSSVLDVMQNSRRIGTCSHADSLPRFSSSSVVGTKNKATPHAEVDEKPRRPAAKSLQDILSARGSSAEKFTPREKKEKLQAARPKLSEEELGSPDAAGPTHRFTTKRTFPVTSVGSNMSPKIDESSIESPNPSPVHPPQIIKCSPIPYYNSAVQPQNSAHPSIQGGRPSPPQTTSIFGSTPADPSIRFLWNPNTKKTPTPSRGIKELLCTEYVPQSTSHEPEPFAEPTQTMGGYLPHKHGNSSNARKPHTQPESPRVYKPFVEASSTPTPSATHQSDHPEGTNGQSTFYRPNNHTNTIPNTGADRTAYQPRISLSPSGSSFIEFPTPPRLSHEKKAKTSCFCGSHPSHSKEKNKKSTPRKSIQHIIPWLKRNKSVTDPLKNKTK